MEIELFPVQQIPLYVTEVIQGKGKSSCSLAAVLSRELWEGLLYMYKQEP